jgi:hypothetical protein
MVAGRPAPVKLKDDQASVRLILTQGLRRPAGGGAPGVYTCKWSHLLLPRDPGGFTATFVPAGTWTAVYTGPTTAYDRAPPGIEQQGAGRSSGRREVQEPGRSTGHQLPSTRSIRCQGQCSGLKANVATPTIATY